MAALLIESLPQNKSSFQIVIRAIELLLLSAGLVSTFFMFKEAVFSPCYSYDFMLSNLRKPYSYFTSWLSSTFYICIMMNIIVFLIAVSSLFHHPKMDNNSTDIVEDGGDVEDYDMHGGFSPSLSPPPMQNSNQKHNQETTKPKEIFMVAEEKTGGGYSKTTKVAKKNQKDTAEDMRNDVERVDASLLDVFSDVSRLTKAKEIIQKAPTTKDAESFEAIFPKLTEAKEIKKSQINTSEKTTIKGMQNRFEQTRKELMEKEDGNSAAEEGDDTMEATWRAIKEGGIRPQKKQLKKSDTWPQPHQTVVNKAADDQENKSTMELDEEEGMLPHPISSAVAGCKEMRKSMTVNDTVSIRCRGGLRRDPSVNLEEFNQKVVAYINNFKNEMRLQRQESEQRYLDMITQGSKF